MSNDTEHIHNASKETTSESDLEVTMAEFRAQDVHDPHWVGATENRRIEGFVAHRAATSFTRPEPLTVVPTAYSRVYRERKEDRELAHGAPHGALLNERPSKVVIIGLRILVWLLSRGELLVAVLQLVLTDHSIVVLLLALFLVGAGLLAGRGLAGRLHGVLRPGPLVSAIRDRVQWPNSSQADALKLTAGLGLMFAVAAIRAIAGGLEGIILVLVRVGLALAVWLARRCSRS